MYGAEGGGGGRGLGDEGVSGGAGGTGSEGETASGSLTVTPGETLTILVGGGGYGGQGGFITSGTVPGGSGGYSDGENGSDGEVTISYWRDERCQVFFPVNSKDYCGRGQGGKRGLVMHYALACSFSMLPVLCLPVFFIQERAHPLFCALKNNQICNMFLFR